MLARGLMVFGDLKGGMEFKKNYGYSTSILACLSALLVPHIFAGALTFTMVMLCVYFLWPL